MESNNRLNIKQNWSTLIYALWTVYSDKWENPITSLSTFHWLKRIVWYRFYSSIVVKKRAIQNNHNLKLFKMLGDERQTEIVFETCLISFGATKLSFQALSIEILRSYCPVGGTRNELTLDIFLRCHLTVENEEREKYRKIPWTMKNKQSIGQQHLISNRNHLGKMKQYEGKIKKRKKENEIACLTRQPDVLK